MTLGQSLTQSQPNLVPRAVAEDKMKQRRVLGFPLRRKAGYKQSKQVPNPALDWHLSTASVCFSSLHHQDVCHLKQKSAPGFLVEYLQVMPYTSSVLKGPSTRKHSWYRTSQKEVGFSKQFKTLISTKLLVDTNYRNNETQNWMRMQYFIRVCSKPVCGNTAGHEKAFV